MSKTPAKRKVADHEMAVMGRIYDLLATLHPPRRRAVYEFIGQRLDDLPVIAQVDAPEPMPMFPDAEARQRTRGDRVSGGAAQ
jgi:hypothetical protein